MAAHPDLVEKIRRLPQQPGVYQFFDEKKRLLYIGKATSLRSRVSSYFRHSTNHSAAKHLMVSLVHDVQTTVVDTEPEALLLETTLIKKFKPPYNVVMKDDKNFQYIHITDEPFSRIETVWRLPMSRRTGKYFGPYTSGHAVRSTLRMLKTIFHYCTTPPELKKGNVVFPKRPCLEFHLGRCIGPCARAISAEEYQRVIAQIAQFLKGDYEPIRRTLASQMQLASKTQAFERAARLRDQLSAIDSLMQEQKVVSTGIEDSDYLSLARVDGKAAVNLFMVRKGKLLHQEVFLLQHTKNQTDEEIIDAFRDQYYSQTTFAPARVYTSLEDRRGRNRGLLEMGVRNAEEGLEKHLRSIEKKERIAEQALSELTTALGLPEKTLHRIEVYDISNIQGTHSVGSMIVFEDGLPKPSQYRKFVIRTVQGPNDFASLQEVMNRRVRHLARRARQMKDPWPRPNLIIIDGGKGQLSAAKAMLDAARIAIPIVSLAKQEEELFVPGRPVSIRLQPGSEGLYLIQRMRDEAHRFAIGFYRKRHLKGLV